MSYEYNLSGHFDDSWEYFDDKHHDVDIAAHQYIPEIVTQNLDAHFKKSVPDYEFMNQCYMITYFQKEHLWWVYLKEAFILAFRWILISNRTANKTVALGIKKRLNVLDMSPPTFKFSAKFSSVQRPFHVRLT